MEPNGLSPGAMEEDAGTSQPSQNRPDYSVTMKSDWDRRAAEDHQFFIASGTAASEEEFRASGKRELEDLILDGISLASHAEALEIGCGVGRLLAPLSTRTARASGVDISDVMIEKSKAFLRDFPNAQTWVTDGSLRPVPDNSLSLVFSYIVFQHIPVEEPIRAYVRESNRVLMPGGIFRFQVDGRGASPWGQQAGTYDGIKFRPEEARDLISGTEFEIVDEWGEGTHYHWITARKKPRGERLAPVAITPRVFDSVVLSDLLERLGAGSPGKVCRAVIRKKTSLRDSLGDVSALTSGDSDEQFLWNAYRTLLGTNPPPESVQFQQAILEKGYETRATLLEAALSGVEFRDLVKPFGRPVPWSLAESARQALGLGLPPAGALNSVQLMALIHDVLCDLGDDEYFETAFEALVGHAPGYRGHEHYLSPRWGTPLAPYLAIRCLVEDLISEKREGPACEDARLAPAVLSRLSGMGVPPRLDAECFPGEAMIARLLLDLGRERSETEFVDASYQAILGRCADEDGRRFWSRKLSDREISRTRFLLELFGSTEFLKS